MTLLALCAFWSTVALVAVVAFYAARTSKWYRHMEEIEAEIHALHRTIKKKTPGHLGGTPGAEHTTNQKKGIA